MFIIVIYFLMSFAVTSCMDTGSSIITSDNKKFIFPQWKIETSRLLHRKQELQKAQEIYYGAPLAPIMLKTICSKKLELFEQAVASKKFGSYFKNLSDENQRLLTCIAGQNELDSPVVTIKLLNYYVCPDVLKQNFFSHFSTGYIVDTLHDLVVIDSCKNKKFESVKNSENLVIKGMLNGDYKKVPKSSSFFANYIGCASYEVRLDTIADKRWFLDKIKIKNDWQCYRVTPATYHRDDNSTIEHNKKNLWIGNWDGSGAVLKKTIQHTQDIAYMCFSNNAEFLATASLPPQAEITLTDLSVENFPDFFLREHGGTINSIFFNDQSTLLAVGSSNGIQLWDLKKKVLAKVFDDCIGKPAGHCVFGNDTFFAACILEGDNRVILNVWDIADVSSTRLINSISFKDCVPRQLSFDQTGNRLIAMTDRNVVLIDARSGKIIMQTDPIAGADWRIHAAIMMPDSDIVAVAATTDDAPMCCVKLWDVASQKVLATLLEDKKNIRTIGVTARRVITIFSNDEVVETSFYDEKSVGHALEWLQDDTVSLLHRYLLQRLHRAHQNNDTVAIHPDCPEHTIVDSLPTEPNARGLVEKYLLKK